MKILANALLAQPAVSVIAFMESWATPVSSSNLFHEPQKGSFCHMARTNCRMQEMDVVKSTVEELPVRRITCMLASKRVIFFTGPFAKNAFQLNQSKIGLWEMTTV